MLTALMTLLATLSSIFRSRAALELENVALRVHGELLNWAKITMPLATVPATSDRPTANAGLAGLFGAERFEKELLVERRLGVRAALKRQEKKEK